MPTATPNPSEVRVEVAPSASEAEEGVVVVEGGPVLEGTAVEPEMVRAAAGWATAVAGWATAVAGWATAVAGSATVGSATETAVYNDARHVATHDDDAEDVSESCTICMSRPRALRFLPCRHAVMCEDCAMTEMQRTGKCSHCRRPVEGLVFVPVSPLRPKRLKTHQDEPEPEGFYQNVQEFLQQATLHRTASEAPGQPARPRAPLSALSFEPSRTFAGPRPGYVFRSGEHGMGYYRDGAETSRLAATGLRPIARPPSTGLNAPLAQDFPCAPMQLLKLLVIVLYAATFHTTFVGWSVVFSTFEPATCRVGRYGPVSTSDTAFREKIRNWRWRNDFEVTVTSGSAVGVSTVAHEFPCGIYASRGPSDGSPSEHVLAFENDVIAAGGGPAFGRYGSGLTKDVPCFVSSRDPNYIQLLDAHVQWSTRKNTCLPLAGTGWLILFLPLIIFIFRPQLFQRLVQRCSQPVTLHTALH